MRKQIDTPDENPRPTEWACPGCGAPWHGHGKGPCRNPNAWTTRAECHGLCCECDVDTEEHLDHGKVDADPCLRAWCFHCGWSGSMPHRAPTDDWKERALRAEESLSAACGLLRAMVSHATIQVEDSSERGLVEECGSARCASNPCAWNRARAFLEGLDH